jgi:transposase
MRRIQQSKESILDPYKKDIDLWLQEDQGRWYKQRHTAKRIYDRLKEIYPAFNCSYTTVIRYVRTKRIELKQVQSFQELVWHAGETQVDFGEADFYERGNLLRKKYLTVSFPYSNDSFTQVFGGETAECVCQGLQDIFNYIGGVPSVMVFDNATGVGRRIGDKIRETDLFSRFRAHYNFGVRFCNPASGHEKGHVENKINYTRNNLFVPPLAYDDIVQFNRELLKQHTTKAGEAHYKKLIPIHTLFEDDRRALRSLPSYPFNVCRFENVSADGYGKVRLDDRHYYATSTEYGGQQVLVGLKAHTVEIYTPDRQVLTIYSRQYGEQRSDHNDYRTSLAILLKNIGAWPNSGIREQLPASLRQAMDEQPREELRQTLRSMQQLSKQYDFDTAVSALDEALRLNRRRFSDAAAMAARIHGYGLLTAPEKGPDLKIYDSLLKGEAPCS